MFVKTVNLWENTPGLCEETPVLDVYVPEKKASRQAVVILPGGGYNHRAQHEGKGYAEFFNEHGITAFVCQYRVYPHRFPLPLLDARRAMRYVRHHSAEYGIDINKVYIMGSSAGGHLAALTSTYQKSIEFEDVDEIDNQPFRPDGQILCYPVIALLGNDIAHFGSGRHLLGDLHAELGETLSPHLIADSSAPRAFVWHTFEDRGVPPTNSLAYAKRLIEQGVNVELHIYPQGAHGQGLAKHIPHTHAWTRELLEWLELENN